MEPLEKKLHLDILMAFYKFYPQTIPPADPFFKSLQGYQAEIEYLVQKRHLKRITNKKAKMSWVRIGYKGIDFLKQNNPNLPFPNADLQLDILAEFNKYFPRTIPPQIPFAKKLTKGSPLEKEIEYLIEKGRMKREIVTRNKVKISFLVITQRGIDFLNKSKCQEDRIKPTQ